MEERAVLSRSEERAVNRFRQLAERDAMNTPLAALLETASQPDPASTFRATGALGITARTSVLELARLAASPDPRISGMAGSELADVWKLFDSTRK